MCKQTFYIDLHLLKLLRLLSFTSSKMVCKPPYPLCILVCTTGRSSWRHLCGLGIKLTWSLI